MNEDDLHNAIVDIISEIKLITGALVYEGDKMLLQVEMIKKFIHTGFGLLTKEEVVYAFYLNSQGAYDEVYRHYNKELNAEFIGDVLRAFLKYKFHLKEQKGDKVARLLSGPPPSVRRDIDYSFWREIIQQEYEQFKNGYNGGHIWHVRKYYTLRKYGMIPYKSIDTWLWFMKKALMNGRYNTFLPAKVDLRNYSLKTVAESRKIFKYQEDYALCVDRARNHAYWYALRSMAVCGINSIWEEIQST